jgi:molybdopterin converting factor small subunit
MLLVNQEYVTPDTMLKEGDRVSVILRISAI